MKLSRFGGLLNRAKGISIYRMKMAAESLITEMNEDPPKERFDEDAALMVKVSEGSEHALRMLIEKWKNPLANYFYRSTSDSHAAEDLCQQTFINLYKSRLSYVKKAKFSTYLFFIARHVLINEHRKNQRRPSDATDPSEMECPIDGRVDLELSELEEIFAKTLESMPENQRTAILLLKQQELSYEDIAQTMGAKIAAVKTWIHRARNTLREALEIAKGGSSAKND